MGFVSFWRHSWLSLTTTAIVALTLLVISSLLILGFLGNIALDSIQNKIDISVYFKDSSSEESVLEIKNRLINLEEVEGIEYISKKQALDKFKAEHKSDSLILDSLDGDENPLPASLEIKAKNPGQYAMINQTLEDPSYQVFISENGVSYYENKSKIDRLISITNFIRKVGLGISLGFIIISLLVVFNSIRVTIYTRKEEIEIMKLVGASNWYVRWPFVIEGVIYGALAMATSLLIIIPLVYYSFPPLSKYLGGVELTNYLNQNLLYLIGFQLAGGILIGVLSSLIAIRKHLKI